ncbi:MAG TPA: TM2 domain-containing protein [Bacteroidia bacterium]|nr:TM2 domain-containing protein [Bacteroidia bacterium]
MKRIAFLKHPRPVIRYDTPASSVIITGDTAVHRHRKHKLFAALLAFPLGVLGLHRLYLGTSPGVPFLYIITFGGAFGVLPFVDFVLILLCKDVNTYAHNKAVFMWTRKK